MNIDEKRNYYENLFIDYPDVLEIPDFRKMLGGISESFARKLAKSKTIKCFLIQGKYLVPKTCAIEYIISDSYQNYKHKLKYRIMEEPQDD